MEFIWPIIILASLGIIFGVLIVWMDGSGQEFDPNNIPEEKIFPRSVLQYMLWHFA